MRNRAGSTSLVLVLALLLVVTNTLFFGPKPAAATTASWWSTAYSQRQSVTIANSTYALSSGYSVGVTINHAAFVTAGTSLANGNDVRVVYWNGSSWTELDRVLDALSSWNSSTTKIWFRTQTAIAASTTDTSYYVYYGNSSATSPPANANNVYDIWDDFSSGSLDTTKWGAHTESGTAVTQTGGEIRITGTSQSGSEQNFPLLYTNNSFAGGYRMESSFSIATESTTAQQNWKAVFGPWEADIGVGSSGSSTKVARYGSGNSWSSSLGTSTLSGQTFGYHRVGASLGSDGSVKYDEDGTTIATRTGAGTSSRQLTLGFTPNIAGETFDARFDNALVRKYVPIEPTVSAVAMPWWNSSYTQRQGVTITNPTSTLPSGYSIGVTINHAALVSGGNSLANGNDVRVASWNGSTWTELDRVLDVSSSWNSSTTKIWFRTQTAIAAATTDTSYYVYFGYASAGAPPANANNVYDLWDDFSSGSLDTTKWGTHTEPGTAVTQTGGEIRFTGTTQSGSEQNYPLLYTANSFAAGYRMESSFSIVTESAAARQNWKAVFGVWEADLGVGSSSSATKVVRYGSGNSWSSSLGTSTLTGQTFGYHRVGESLGSDGSMQYDEDGTTIATRTGAATSSRAPTLGFTPNVSGETYDARFDNALIRKYVPTEPTITVNRSPSLPTSLAQYRSNGSTSIATNGWTNQASVVFKASVTDADGSDSVRLCVKLNGGAAQCGAPVSYVGTPLTASVTVSGLTSGTAYTWTAATEDSAETYSGYSAFNSGATAFTVDTVAPSVPSSPAQFKTDGTTSVGVGAWTNQTSIIHKATVTDAASPVALCVEEETISTAWTNTEQACGTAVTSGQTAALGGLIDADGSRYHWQARAQDAAGNYSAWVSFGGNSDGSPPGTPAASDFGVDTTAPVVGTVYDGSSVGTEVKYNSGSLSSLSANWSATDASSGIASYSYTVGTSPGASDVATSTSVGAVTSTTINSLILQTSKNYYVTIVAYDAAGNASSAVSSPGQIVAPTLTFATNTQTVDLGMLASGATATTSLTLTTSTNAHNGYRIFGRVNSLPTSTLTSIPNFNGGTYAAPDAWQAGDTGVGYTSTDTSVGGTNIFQPSTCLGGTVKTAPGCFAPFATSGIGDVVADDLSTISGSPIVGEVFTLSVKVALPALQPAGSYQASLVLTAVASY